MLKAKETRYSAVARALCEEIGRGVFPVGSMLPPEPELCSRFGVSRHTVREAVRHLEELHLVLRHHGVGTRVEASEVPGRYVQSLGAVPDLRQYVKNTRLEILNRSTVMPAEAHELRMCEDQSSQWAVVEGLRYVEGQNAPICWTRIFVLLRYRRALEASVKKSVPIWSVIEQQFNEKVTAVEQEIGATAVPARTARLLKVSTGSPGLSTLRSYHGRSGAVFEVALSVHPADRFTYRTELHLEYPTKAASA